MFGKDVWSSFIKNCPEDVLYVKKEFESKKKVIKESSNDTITMKFPVALVNLLREKRQFKGKMAEYIEQTTYSHSVKAVNDQAACKKSRDIIYSYHKRCLLVPSFIVQVSQAKQNYIYSQTCIYKSHSREHESQSN
jgi:hypothetical protein